MESKDKLSALKNDFNAWQSKREKGTPVPNALKERACKISGRRFKMDENRYNQRNNWLRIKEIDH